MTKRYAIVIARYLEDIRWMSYLGRRPEWDVIVYNDGPDLDPYYTPNFTIHKGDRVPAEASKYLQFICDYFDTMHKYEWIVFTQADPFEHSPDFVGLLESTENWQAPFQGLTYGPFPGFFAKHNISPKSSLGGFRVWNDCLNQNWVGCECDERPTPVHGAGSVSNFFDFYGAKLGTMKLWFCACFAATPGAIHTQTHETWKRLHEASKRNFEVIDEPRVWNGWVHTPNEFKLTVSEKKQNKEFGRRVNNKKFEYKMNIGKAFAYLMELAWHPLLVHEAFHEPKIVVQEVVQEEIVAQEVVQKDVIQESLYLKPLNEYEKVIVVARYNENIDWIHKVANNFDFIMVFNKGTPIKLNLSNSVIIPCHNVGREGETYLRYIKQYFDVLPTYTVFTQGDPFTHNPNMIQTLKDIKLTGKINALSAGWKFGYPKEYTMENNQCRTYVIDTRTFQVRNFHDDGVERFVKLALNDAGLKKNSDLICNVCKQVGLVIPPRHIYFVYSALFAVHKDAIKSNDISVYESLYRYLHSKNLQGGAQGYILERLWYYIFTHKNK
jgi:hypothetical protein